MNLMPIRKFNIQIFGQDILTANTVKYAGVQELTEETNFTYYEKILEDAEYMNKSQSLLKYVRKISFPKNSGKTLTIWKSGKYKMNDQVLIEGVTPGEDEGMATYSQTLRFGTLASYITISDEMIKFAPGEPVMTRYMRNQAKAREEMINKRIRKGLYSTRNAWFASPRVDGLTTPITISPTDSLQDVRDKVGKFNISDIGKMKVFFDRNDVIPFEDGNYIMLVTPEVADDIQSVEKNNKEFTWLELNAAVQNTEALLGGVIGVYKGVKFVKNRYLSEISKTTGGASIHGCLFLGKTMDGEGAYVGGTPFGTETFIKELGSSGAEDPVNQKASIGWKQDFSTGVIDDVAVIRYECLSSEILEQDADAKLRSNPHTNYAVDYKGNAIDLEDANLGVKPLNGNVVMVYKTNGKSYGPILPVVTDSTTTYGDLVTFLNTQDEIKNEYTTVAISNLFTDKGATASVEAGTTIPTTNGHIVYIKK